MSGKLQYLHGGRWRTKDQILELHKQFKERYEKVSNPNRVRKIQNFPTPTPIKDFIPIRFNYKGEIRYYYSNRWLTRNAIIKRQSRNSKYHKNNQDKIKARKKKYYSNIKSPSLEIPKITNPIINSKFELNFNYNEYKNLIKMELKDFRFFHDQDTLISAAWIGVLNALRLYQDNKGASLKTFIKKKIRYALLDEVRIRENNITKRDLAIENAQKYSRRQDSESEQETDDLSLVYDEYNNPESLAELKINLEEFKGRLDKRELVIVESVLNGETLREISKRLKITESYVSQILKSLKEDLI